MTDTVVICRSVVERADGRLVEIDFGDSDLVALEPLAPGALYLQEPRQTTVFELHRVVSIKDNFIVFESFKDAVPMGWHNPAEGQQYHWRGWLIPAAWDAIQSDPDEWSLQVVKTDHEHCVVTWETLFEGDKGYYRPVLKEWMSPDAFQNYMRDDIYRLRQMTS